MSLGTFMNDRSQAEPEQSFSARQEALFQVSQAIVVSEKGSRFTARSETPKEFLPQYLVK
jgi:hypothetical protein